MALIIWTMRNDLIAFDQWKWILTKLESSGREFHWCFRMWNVWRVCKYECESDPIGFLFMFRPLCCVSFRNFILLKMFSISNWNQTHHWLPLMRLYCTKNSNKTTKVQTHTLTPLNSALISFVLSLAAWKRGETEVQNTPRYLYHHHHQYNVFHTFNGSFFTHLFSVRVCTPTSARHRHTLSVCESRTNGIYTNSDTRTHTQTLPHTHNCRVHTESI